jgi:hypothetical protein
MSIWFVAGGEHDEMRFGDTLVRWWEWHADTGAGVFLDKLGDVGGDSTVPSIAAYTGDRSTRCPMNGDSFQGQAVGNPLWGDNRMAQWRYACRAYPNAWPAAESGTIKLSAIGPIPYAVALLQEDGKVQLRGDFGGTTKTSTSSFTLATGEWHAVVLWFDWVNAEAKCWIDDETVLTVSDSGNESEATFTGIKVYHGENLSKGVNKEMVLWVDDCVFNDTEDSVHDWGAVATPVCWVDRRATDGDVGAPDADWLEDDDSTGTHLAWDETNQPDDDTTYNYSDTNGVVTDQLSTLEAHGLTENDTLVCVVQYDMDRSVTSTTTDYLMLSRQGANRYTHDPGLIGTGYVTRWWFHQKDPSGVAWTTTLFDSFMVGGRKNGNDAVEIRVTVCAVNIVGYFTAPVVGVRRMGII